MTMRDRKRILLVEDDELTLSMTRRMLVDAGYLVDAALESGSAIKLLTSNDYNLVILDISMPTLTGFDLVQLMESFQIKSKVAFLSNLNDKETRKKVEKIKVDRLISKENELKILPDIVEELIAG